MLVRVLVVYGRTTEDFVLISIDYDLYRFDLTGRTILERYITYDAMFIELQ